MNFFVNEAMDIGNSGVEHAEFYRAKLFKITKTPYKFIFMNLIENLHESMSKWNLSANEVINMWEYFVLGNEYPLHGLTAQQEETMDSVLVDSTETNRMIRSITVSGVRVMKYLIKKPNPDNLDLFLVSTRRIELFSDKTGQKKATYELAQIHKETVIRNIHLFNQGNFEKHLFFLNEIQLRRYFFDKSSHLFEEKNVFIIERGQASEVALL